MFNMPFAVSITIVIIFSIVGAVLLKKQKSQIITDWMKLVPIFVMALSALIAANDANYALWAILAVAAIGSSILYIIRSNQPKP